MKLKPPLRPGILGRLAGVFNLHDPRWGRGEGARQENNRPEPGGGGPRGPNQGPPDLDELWSDFNRRLGSLFGRGRQGEPGGGGGGNFPPDMKSTGIGVGLIALVVVLIWLGTGFFIVQEGQQAVITQFGRYQSTVGAGIHWRLPYPIQRHEAVTVTQIRSVDIGHDGVMRSTGLRDAAMLTQDENIVEIKFAVQYRLKDPRAWLFGSKDPADTVVNVAEAAVREVVGNMRMDQALADERDQIAPRVRKLMQSILDRYGLGVDVMAVNLQQGGVRPPEQVQAAFDDVLKAGQERERAKNEAQAYANDVIPRAVGSASRLREEAEAYKARVVAQAQGDAQRFDQVLAQYLRAPQVTRDRMYLDALQQIYGNANKVLVDSRPGSQMLYLPIDKLMQSSGAAAAGSTEQPAAPPAPAAGTPSSGGSGYSSAPVVDDARSRDNLRTRERNVR